MLKALIAVDPEQRPRTVRMCASATRITGPLNLNLLEKSISSLIRRHEALRTTFRTTGGATTQHIDPPEQHGLTYVDLSALSNSAAQRAISEFQNQKIDASVGPLFEARLFRLGAWEHALIVLVDHMISDGMSNALLDKEIWQAYDGAPGEEPASLPTPSIQFADYAVWQDRTREAWKRQHENYWQQHLAQGAATIVPVSPDASERPDMKTAHMPFGPALTAQLRQFAQRQGASLASVMLMVYATAMSLWCSKEDLIIRLPVHGRFRPELENVVGLLCDCVYLRVRVDRRCTFEGLLALVRDEMRNALAHRDFDRVLDLMPDFLKTELEFHWRPAHWRERSTHGRPGTDRAIKRQPYFVRSPTWNLKLFCLFNETPSDICATVHYRESSLSFRAVEQLVNDMRWVARTLLDRSLDSIDRAVAARGREMHDAS